MNKPILLLVASVGPLMWACVGPDRDFNSGSAGSAAGGSGGTGQSSSGMGTGGMGTGGLSPLCGDGDVHYSLGEECDDANTTPGDGCSAQCTIEPAASCGNGTLDLASNEECDDGNVAAGDGCSPSCQLEPTGQSCGNSMIEGIEACDDGNTANGDGCNPTCTLQGTSTLFVGSPGQTGSTDGVGMAARIGGAGVLTANATHLFLGDGYAVRRIEIATATVQTIAGNAMMAGNIDSPTGADARFGSTYALATDGATIWVGDTSNHVIRAVSTTPPYAVTTAIGSGVLGHVDGIGAAVRIDDARGLTYYNGYVFLVDGNASTLRRYHPATGEVVTLAGSAYVQGQTDGLGPAARFMSPRYMASDGSGMLYIADTNGSKIRSYNTVTTEVRTFAGTDACGYVDGPSTAAQVHRPRGITSDGSSIYWLEFNAHTIRQAPVATGEVTTLAGTPAACTVTCSCGNNLGGYLEGTGAMTQWNSPFHTVFHFPSRSLFVVDGGNFVIRRIQ
jgi:cysteine-rich repeat protein